VDSKLDACKDLSINCDSFQHLICDIYDMLGDLVVSIMKREAILQRSNLHNLKAGIYMLTVSHDDGFIIHSQKIIKA